MKKVIYVVGTLFFLLMSNLAFAQKSTTKSKERKVEKIQTKENSKAKILVETPSKKGKKSSIKSPATKAEEKEIVGIDPLSGANTKAEENSLDVPDFMKNPKNQAEKNAIYEPDTYFYPNSKTNLVKVSKKLSLENISYEVKQSKNGFSLYKSGSSNIYAELVPSKKEGFYKYLQADDEHLAHFDENGDIIVIYLNPDSNQKKEIRFKSN